MAGVAQRNCCALVANEQITGRLLRRTIGGRVFLQQRGAHFQLAGTLPPVFPQERVSKSVDKETAPPIHARIGNNLIASNHSPNRPTLVANRNTIFRA